MCLQIKPRLIHSKTAATRPLPIEKALKTDILTILAVYHMQYTNTNQRLTISILCCAELDKYLGAGKLVIFFYVPCNQELNQAFGRKKGYKGTEFPRKETKPSGLHSRVK